MNAAMHVLEHVAYVSELTVELSDQQLGELLVRARANNAALNLTGILLLVDRSFFQVLEGPPLAVAAVYEKIAIDRRHHRLLKLIQEPIEHRDFQDWSMGLVRVTSNELAGLPGLHDAAALRRNLETLGEGLARRLLREFRDGRWRARVA